MSDVEWPAVLKGAGISGGVFLGIFALRTGTGVASTAALALFALAMVGFGAGGFVAATNATRRHVFQAGIAGLLSGVATQVLVFPVRVSREERFTVAAGLVGAPLATLLAASCAIAGGYIALRRGSITSREPTSPKATDSTGGNLS